MLFVVLLECRTYNNENIFLQQYFFSIYDVVFIIFRTTGDVSAKVRDVKMIS